MIGVSHFDASLCIATLILMELSTTTSLASHSVLPDARPDLYPIRPRQFLLKEDVAIDEDAAQVEPQEGILLLAGHNPPVNSGITVEARGKRKKAKFGKYVLPLVIGFLLIKSILLPVALKALAVLSGKAVVLSLMSLILAAIVGLKKVAQDSSGHNYEVVNVPLTKYRRNDILETRSDREDEAHPYQFYKEGRRKK
ncbi:uncharacterized protein LOC107263027 [Cephus cinctus]|uniref:Uncharacterized protein LOC107263027 n=1 Tax=Cephus cinctus TaxID=211228 RepID=A0AAJ7BGC3_CEPCN|nr:uncharacterized protein LOC107263027 [Cephus cinctus]